MKNNYMGIFVILILLVLAYSEYKPNKSISAPTITTSAATAATGVPVDYTAGFAVFIHNSFRSFYNPQYYNLSEDIYVQGDNPNIIYIKKAGQVWGGFFEMLGIDITEHCLTMSPGQVYCSGQGGELKFFLNGKRVKEILTEEIHKGDKLLVTYGFETEEAIALQLSQVAGSGQ